MERAGAPWRLSLREIAGERMACRPRPDRSEAWHAQPRERESKLLTRLVRNTPPPDGAIPWLPPACDCVSPSAPRDGTTSPTRRLYPLPSSPPQHTVRWLGHLLSSPSHLFSSSPSFLPMLRTRRAQEEAQGGPRHPLQGLRLPGAPPREHRRLGRDRGGGPAFPRLRHLLAAHNCDCPPVPILHTLGPSHP